MKIMGLVVNNVARAEAYLRTKWHLDPSSLAVALATTDMGRKLGALPLFGGGARYPSNTMWPGPRPTSVPSGILIHPCSRLTKIGLHQRYRQTDRTDNGPIVYMANRFTNGRPKSRRKKERKGRAQKKAL